MTDIPRRTAARTAKLASLPLGVAGRAAAGWGRRLAGGNGDEISAQVMAKSAEQLFAVLGELKGGAMKFGQALSVFEAAIPDEFAAPFRESLVKLQTAAPPMSSRRRALGAVRAVRPGVAGPVPGVRGDPGGRGQHRSGAPRGVAGRARGGRQAAVPRGRGGAALRPAAAVPDEPGDAAAGTRAGDQAADRGAARTDGGGARLPGRGGQPAHLRRRLRGRRAGRGAQGRGLGAAGAGHRVDQRAQAVGRDPARAPRRSGTSPRDCSPSSTTPRRPGSGCCTPTRIRATSSCCPTGA